MSIIKTAIALFLSIVMFILNGIGSLLPGFIPEAKSASELEELADIFDEYPLAEEIVVVRSSKLTKDERAAVTCLQGLVGRTEASIFINYGYDSKTELRDLENAGCKLLYTDAGGNEWSLKNLIPRYASHIKDNGYVLFTDSNTHAQINMAFNLATVYGWLAVPQSAEGIVKALGMEKREDLTDDELDFNYQRDFYNKHKDEFRKDALVHLYSYASGLRDLAVQQRIFITYVEDDDYIGRTFRDQILNDLEPASVVLGWCKYEVKFTESVSSFGHYVIPSDHSFNASILTCNQIETVSLGRESETVELDPEKHYVAIVYSDGDNAQWISNGYKEFYTWQSYDIDTPITWTFAPQMSEFSPTAVNKALDNLGEDSFITGPSGAGYARISKMAAKELEAYSDLTAAAMLRTGMTTMTLLDTKPNLLTNSLFANKLKYFARYDNIHGGIIQMDPDRYSSGEGRVYFVNDKPFVSVRLSLWHPSGSAEEVTQEWLREQAEIVNGYPADIGSINGYTVINVHPWTVGPDDLAYFISQLDDGVEVISADDMIAALTANIPHKYATPEKG